MIYPIFLKEEDTIGVVALSSGVGRKLGSFDESIEYIESYGFNVVESASVRNNAEPSNDAKIRCDELHSLISSDCACIWSAAGGDFQFETLPYMDFEMISQHPKWFVGASDPTNLLFPVTCKCDIATLYGFNAGSFDRYGQDDFSKGCLNFLMGKDTLVQSSLHHQHVDFYNDGAPILNTQTKYIGSCHVTGRLLGGCFESINDIAGTPFDYVIDFLDRYKSDSIIWFFDIFSMNSCDVYRALLKMKYMGYFKYTNTILVGRVLFENVSDLIGYHEAFKRALPTVNCIFETDIGHTTPHFYVVNGCMANVCVGNGVGKIEYLVGE